MHGDKFGGPPKNQATIKDFQKVVVACELKDLGFTGHLFT